MNGFQILTIFCLAKTVLFSVGSAQCYPDKGNYYLFVMGHCYQENQCCKNNLECESGCCDPYTSMCNTSRRSRHFLDNFPYSTACMSVPTTFEALKGITD
jgi:hypothetical protein